MYLSAYFVSVVLVKRPYLQRQLDHLEAVVRRPLRSVEQVDGRTRHWGWVGTEIYRVVVLPDGETIHNAFPDPHAEAY